MKEAYIDKYGNDSLRTLRDASMASKDGKKVVFVTSNESVLEDRDELEAHFNVRIVTPAEVRRLKAVE